MLADRDESNGDTRAPRYCEQLMSTIRTPSPMTVISQGMAKWVIALFALALLAGSNIVSAEGESARDHEDRPQTILLATTTSTENSGLLDHLHPHFERATGIHVRVLARGTGAALRAGRDGNCDVLLVHDRERELQFVREGFGVYHHHVMYNDFVLVGPPEDPAGIRGMNDIVHAFSIIAGRKSYFVSRGDDSGTHGREKEIWKKVGFTLDERGFPLKPDGETSPPSSTYSETPAPASTGGGSSEDDAEGTTDRWYLSVGQGMAKTLTIAYEKRGYTLTDRGTYLSQKNRFDLEIMVEGDTRLHNPYGVMAVNPALHPHVRYETARRYIDWLVSPEAQRLISQFTIEGESLFHPGARRRDVPEEEPSAETDTEPEGDS